MDILGVLFPFIAIFLIMYFLMIRPAQKRQKQMNEMQAGLEKGDEVVTIGGLTGEVESFDANYMYLKVDENTTLRFERRALHQVVNK